MPAPKVFVGSADIAELLGISRRQAQYIVKMFEDRGQTLFTGRALRVSLRTFAKWVSDNDGSDPAETFDTLKAALKTA